MASTLMTYDFFGTPRGRKRWATSHQPQLITRLLAGHHYTVNLQPAMINNQLYIGTHTATGFNPLLRTGC